MKPASRVILDSSAVEIVTSGESGHICAAASRKVFIVVVFGRLPSPLCCVEVINLSIILLLSGLFVGMKLNIK